MSGSEVGNKFDRRFFLNDTLGLDSDLIPLLPDYEIGDDWAIHGEVGVIVTALAGDSTNFAFWAPHADDLATNADGTLKYPERVYWIANHVQNSDIRKLDEGHRLPDGSYRVDMSWAGKLYGDRAHDLPRVTLRETMREVIPDPETGAIREFASSRGTYRIEKDSGGAFYATFTPKYQGHYAADINDTATPAYENLSLIRKGFRYVARQVLSWGLSRSIIVTANIKDKESQEIKKTRYFKNENDLIEVIRADSKKGLIIHGTDWTPLLAMNRMSYYC